MHKNKIEYFIKNLNLSSLNNSLNTKMLSYGCIADVDLFEWALAQTVGGTFMISGNTVTNVPDSSGSWFRGILSVDSGDRGILLYCNNLIYSIQTQSSSFDNCYWCQYASQYDLSSYLPLTGGTMTGDIMGDAGGIFCRDGNIYMTAGGYNKYLTGILSEISATANAAYARAFRLKDTSGNSIAGVFNNLSNGDIAWGYSWDVKSDAHPNDTQASWHIYEYYRGDGYYNIVKVYCDSGIFVGRWDTGSNTIVWNHDVFTKGNFSLSGSTLYITT